VGVNFLAYYSRVLGVLDGIVEYLGTSNKVIEIFTLCGALMAILEASN
jgi:phage shock protein PspC (stress-responsive transcriptional regulator)